MRPLTVLLSCALYANICAATQFDACLVELQEQARNAGVSTRILDQVIPTLQQQDRVLELDRKQPEFVKTFAQYFTARVTPQRIERGRQLYEQHRKFLQDLAHIYGVPGQYVVAFWGLETNFGGYMGKFPTLDSLATLACDARRSTFFSNEFVAALQLMERESLAATNMRGSWAGAVGHTQFMPTSYNKYALDGDGDGRVDLWQSERDALASAANFLKHLGWEKGWRWGREVSLPEDFAFELTQSGTTLPLSAWAGHGVRSANGSPLPVADLEAAALLPAGAKGPAFLVYPNFSVIMGWNRSEFYALSVGHLADRILGGEGLQREPPTNQKALSREQILELQRRLNAAGYAAGPEDGYWGPATRAALQAFQRARGLTADGFPDAASLDQLGKFNVN